MRTAVAGALALVAAVAVGACTSSDPVVPVPTPTATPTLASAGRFETPGELGTALRDAALRAGSARGTINARSVDGTLDADVAYEFAAADVRIAAEASVVGAISADLGIVLTDGTVYVRVPPLYRLFTSADWVRVPQDASSDVGQQVDGLLEALAAEVPGDSLLDVEEGAGDVELRFLGGADVDGTSVERYELSATMEGVDVTRTYWVDADDQLVRLDSTADDPAAAEPSVSVATYDAWGVPVQVEAPDPADVADFPEGLL